MDVVNNAFSRISLATFLRINESKYSIKTASKGKVRGPLLGNPNSSSANLRISLKMPLLRYAKGSTNRLESVVYTTKQPFSAVDVDVPPPPPLASASWFDGLGNVILFPLIATSRCHVLAILTSFLVPINIVMFACISKKKKLKNKLVLRKLKERYVIDRFSCVMMMIDGYV